MKCSITISRSDLLEHNACEDGLALFDSFAQGQEEITIPWGTLEYLWLEAETKFASWLYFAKLAPLPNFSKLDLSGANLSSVDLSFANLSSANLSFANLSSVDLYSADLSSANLSFANLYSANFSSANLSSADLYSANLSFANLYSADLSGAYRGKNSVPIPGWEVDENGYLKRK